MYCFAVISGLNDDSWNIFQKIIDRLGGMRAGAYIRIPCGGIELNRAFSGTTLLIDKYGFDFLDNDIPNLPHNNIACLHIIRE